MKAAVVVAETDAALRAALCAALEAAGWRTRGAADGLAALEALEAQRPALVVGEIAMRPPGGLELLQAVRERCPGVPVVLTAACGSIAQAVAATRAGAAEYLVKPFDPQALVGIVARLLENLPHAGDAVAADPLTREVYALAARVAASEATVLIGGPSGTGKEVLARYIHRHSPRAAQPFVAINCAAIPDNMLEAMLFGYERGAFTGALQAHAGKFEQAQGGTLLLDEISELPLALQAKLLRVLQEREVERLGARRPVTLDVRVLATTNRDLAARVASGTFREDLYYRLNVFPLGLAPLAQRAGDIPALARHLLARHGGAHARLEPEALARLCAHAWPGNVRELENVIQRALILAGDAPVGAGHICITDPLAMPGAGMRPVPVPAPLSAPIAAPAAAFPAPAFPPVLPTRPVDAPVEEGAGGFLAEASGAPAAHALGREVRGHEAQLILAALGASHGRREVAAARLGISPRTLRYKLAQLRAAGVAVPQPASA